MVRSFPRTVRVRMSGGPAPPARRSRPRSPAAASAPATRPTGGTELTVSRNFGAEELGHSERKTIPGGETVMRQLQRKFEVETRYGGGFVQEIDGVSGGRRSGRPVDWFFYVNGIEADSGAAARRLAPGDRVWWDHHDWGGAMRVPAVVGSFPEPFLSGAQGKRIPVRIDCAEDAQRECREVRKRLEEAGAKVGGSGDARHARRARACCGCSSAAGRRSASTRRRGGSRAGRRSRACSRGRTRPGASFELLDPRGERVRSLGAGAGLVAATRFLDQQPTWVVTGTDEVGRRRGGRRAGRGPAEGPLRDRAGERARGAAAAPVRRGGDAVTYRRRSSPLHAARAGVGSLFCVVLAGVALSFEHPLLLGALLLAVLAAGAGGEGGRRRGALAAVGAAVRAADRGRSTRSWCATG